MAARETIHTLHHKPNTTTFFVGPRCAQLLSPLFYKPNTWAKRYSLLMEMRKYPQIKLFFDVTLMFDPNFAEERDE